MPTGSKAVYLRHSALSANDWPCLGIAALIGKENGRVKEFRLALSGLASTPLSIDGLDFVRDRSLDDAILARISSTVDQQIAPFSDLRGSEWYKRRMAAVFVKRAIAQLEAQA
jgi:carbon-monoxide dehydrogenase medium subunit